MKEDKVMFLYGKLGNKRTAKIYCDLHKCYLNRSQLFGKKFKCEKCKHKREVE